jgi:glycosyltransferase involved in cell wall biosynthesis
MTRLLICTPTHALQGGVERILEALALHLPARGFDVTFALARGARFHDPDRYRAAFPHIQSFDVDGTSGTAYGRRRALRRVMERVDPDLVLIARMFDAYPVASALKRKGHRLRLAVTVQGYEPEYFVDLVAYAAFLDLCVTSGELIARAVPRFTSVPAERVVSIPGGVAAPSRLVAHGPGPLRLGYVGRLEQLQKRIRDLPLLANELTRRGVPFTLTIAGAGSLADEVRAALPDAAFVGWLTTAELYERVYPELDVLVHFAEWEGVTIAPREAMVHGVVPVVSRFTGLAMERQMIEGENALTFAVGDIAAAADCIECLHRDRTLLARLAANAAGSQQGIRSEEGALDAWAAAFQDALVRPARVGSALPLAPGNAGLLTRLRVPPAVAEGLRRLRRREHDEPGAEWPHWSGVADPELARRLVEFARGT